MFFWVCDLCMFEKFGRIPRPVHLKLCVNCWAQCQGSVVPGTLEEDVGGSSGSRSLRPAWANQRDLVLQKKGREGRREKGKRNKLNINIYCWEL